MKKILLLGVILFFTLFTETKAFTPYFEDTDEHWAEYYMETLRSIDILKGSNYKAKPNDKITREEFCALIVRTFYDEFENSNKEHFTDVDNNNIFAPYIYYAYEKGIIKGTSENSFSPKKFIKREEIALIISRLGLLKKPSKKPVFNDISAKYQYYNEISLCAGNGIINGYDDNTFRPNHNALRAETSAMIVRVLENTESDNRNVKEFAQQIVSSDFESKEFLMKNSIGKAKNDVEFILEMNITPKNQIAFNFQDEKHTEKGMISTHKFYGEASVNGRNIDITAEYKILNKNGKYYLFDRNIDFKDKKRINLTWEVSSSPPSYSPKGVTHISPSFFEISSEHAGGKRINIGNDYIHLYDRINPSYMQYALTNGYEIWAMYKTDFTSKTANKFLNDKNAEKNLIKYIADKCQEHNISGINFDFENMFASDKEEFYTHIHNMELILHEIGVFVSADITRYEKTSLNWSMCYDRNKLNEFCDYIMLMAYDQYYAGSKHPGPVAGLGWTENSVKLTLNEVNSDKLILGIPFYTRYWTSVNNNVISTKAISMETAIKLIKENNALIIYKEKDNQHMAYWQKDGKDHSFWFETAETVGKRVDIANKYNLAGVSSWRRGFETADVWDEIYKKLNN